MCEASAAGVKPYSDMCLPLQVHAQWLADVDSVTGYEQTGCASSMFANRLSWFYNFKGPSKIVDTGGHEEAPACMIC